MRRRALTAILLSFAAVVLAAGASFLIYHAVVDAAVPGSCGGG